MKSIGQPLPHESAEGHVTGRALYTDDLVERHPGALHAWPVCAPLAHAMLVSLDVAAARKMPGVHAVLTGSDVTGENDTGAARHDEPLFPSEISYHSQPVAWVIAESEEQARLAAIEVTANYDPLTPILGIEQAIAADSFLTDQLAMCRGDPEKAMAAAPKRLSGELAIGGQEHFYLETQCAFALIDEAEQLVVHSSTQHPSETQAIVARVLGIQKAAVTVQALRMGGAFGGKETQANAWAAVAALAARKTGRPVRVRLDRPLDMALTGKRHPFLARFEVGFDDRGKLLALTVRLWSDGGWSLDLSEPVLYRAMFHLDNCYLLPDVEVVGRVCKTHKCSQTAFRGFGGPQGMLVGEEIVDRVARSLGLPPHVVRERNFYREGDATHYGQAVKQPDRIRRIWSELADNSSLEARQKEVARHNAEHPYQKRGLAITPVKFGISFTTAFFNQAGALVLVYQDGSLQVNHGGTEMGQGLHTKIQQIAAQALGVPLDSVRLMPTRTDKVPNTSATAASAGSDLNGAAVRQACDILRERLAEVAASELGVSADTLEFEAGNVVSRSAPDRSIPFSKLTKQAYLARVPLFAAGYYKTPNLHFDKATATGKPFHYFAYGAAVSEVEVDGFTGQYELRRVDILHDVGDSLSPLVDLGQIEGGFLQGVGWLTREELLWDAQGRVVTRGASTYKLPGLGDCPEIFNVRLLKRAADPDVIHGSKAVGEPPLMLAISVREALKDAVAAFGRGGGIVELACPATPEAVFWAIESQRSR
jgi:xanthine dehydrogenase large subunit